MTGRARGRSRGRARGTADDQSQRPGEPVQPPPQPIMHDVIPEEGNRGLPGAVGRAAYRGGARKRHFVPDNNDMLVPMEDRANAARQGNDLQQQDRAGYRWIGEVHRTRPENALNTRGTSGVPVQLITNHFKVELLDACRLFQYHVDFNPPVYSKKMRFGLLFEDHSELLGENRVFDGSTLFLFRKLQNDETVVFSQRRTDGEKIQITIKVTNAVPPGSPQCIHILNIIFRRFLARMGMHEIRRNYYDPKLLVDIPRFRLQILPGFSTSVLQFEQDVMLSCDISHKILNKETVLDVMYNLHSWIATSEFHAEVKKKILGTTVMTRYNNKTYRVDDIAWDMSPNDTFDKRGTAISYRDYYKQNYDIDIADAHQPLLLSRPKKNKDARATRGRRHEQNEDKLLYLLPELCVVTGLSAEARADHQLMGAVAQTTRPDPPTRIKRLTDFIQEMNSNPDVRREMSRWRLRISEDPVSVNSREMPRESVYMQDMRQDIAMPLVYQQARADWSREMYNKRMVTAVSLRSWMVVNTWRDQQQTNALLHYLKIVGQPLGMGVNDPMYVRLRDDDTNSYIRGLRDNMTGATQMVVCVLPTNRKERYDTIKKYTCVDHPVPCQVVLSRTLRNKRSLMSIATKIAIQINCKMGGEVWAVRTIPNDGLMVVGIDTYHDSARKDQSVVGFVASLNTTLTRYYSQCTFQGIHQEIGEKVSICYRGALTKYYEINGSLPRCIVVFRDGVGDGQLDTVKQQEIDPMLNCLTAVGGQDYTPMVGYVIVKKRINTRFFARNGHRLNNPIPGTVVDNTVTRPEWYDFFIVSQSVRQGTVTPTHYNVIYDTTDLLPDHMQRLAYRLCHLYYNWPGTIRVPAPCQYAHKLAFLVGQSIHREPALELCDKLFFL